MELQGVVLAGVVLIAAFYVLPYVYRRRHILSQAPVEDGYSKDLRILDLSDVQVSKDEKSVESYESVFIGGNEVGMSKAEAVVDIRSLARERAKRRARVAKREANRTRGFVGAIVFGVLCVALWVLSATLMLPVAVSIVASVLFAVYVGGFAYLISQMNRANEADLKGIDELDSQMKAMRRSASKRAQRRASSRVGRNIAVGARKNRGQGREKKLASGSFMSSQDFAAQFGSTETIMSSRSSAADSPVVEPVSRSDESLVSAGVSVPSYTLKRSELVQRDIEPYEPPAMPEGDVPYRPKEVGERFNGDVEVSSVEQSLGGGALLDDILARRRA